MFDVKSFAIKRRFEKCGYPYAATSCFKPSLIGGR